MITQLPSLYFSRQLPSKIVNDLECTTEIKLLIMEAEKAGVSWEVVPFSDVCRFTYHGHTEYSRFGGVSTNRTPGPIICENKYLTRQFLIDAGLPVVKGYLVMSADSPEDRNNIFNSLTKPLVVKPSLGSHGIGVKLNITSISKMNHWIDYLFANEEKDKETRKGMILVEETAVGSEYRIVATKERVLAVMHRKPASVIGDAKHSIKELIAIKNQDPMRNFSLDTYPHITIDEEMREILGEQHSSENSVPLAGQYVFLRRVSNVMAGGDAIDVTDEIHSSVAKMALRVTRAIPGMSLVGIDYMTTDIAKDQSKETCAIIEVNRTPEYDMHDIPMFGKSRGVAKAVLEMMFPELPVEHSPSPA